MDLIIDTAQGRIKGLRRNGVRQWRGVRYARAGRFEAPRPVQPGDGVIAATAFAPQCPQNFSDKPKAARIDPPGFSEDCLALNIYAPDAEPDRKRPVMVWIHGGAFIAGAGDAYDGSDFALNGDIVVVTVNYRLGVLGFVNFGEVLGWPDIPSNLGLRDQVAALQWVRDNIAAFGGDPDRVTIAGESAGSTSVSLLMLHRPAWGLFHGAILQSGAISLIHGRDKSLALAKKYAERLGLDQSGPEKLRSMDLRALFGAQSDINGEEAGGIPAAPWYDGDMLPDSLADAQRAAAAPVPLIAGFNREEIRLFEMMPGDILPTTWPALETIVRQQLPAEHAAALLAAYPRGKAGRRALATDLTFAMPARHFAERQSLSQPSWFYRFDYSHPLVGAAHGLDLAFIWPFSGPLALLARGGPMRGRRAWLASLMKSHWSLFVQTGRPGESWPAYAPERRATMLFDLDSRVEDDPDADRRRAWRGMDIAPRIVGG